MKANPALLFTLSVVIANAANGQANWPRLRGPNGDGLACEAKIPSTWTVDDYRWTIKLPGEGHASPVVWGKRVYCMCALPDSARRVLVCVRSEDGTTAWRRVFPSNSFRQHVANGFATATPAVDAHGVVIVWTTPDSIRVVSLDHNGRTMWDRDLGPFVAPHGSGSSPIIHEGTVVLTNMQEDTQLLGRIIGRENPEGPIGMSQIVALDRLTGEDRWRRNRRTTLASYSTPCVRQGASGKTELIYTSTSHGISAVDIINGNVLWELPDLFEDRCVGSPILVNNMVLASYGHGARGSLLAAVRPMREGPPKVVYRVTKSVPLVPTPIAMDSLVYLWADSGVVTCIRAETGQLVWQERVGGNYFGSPVCVGHRLYCIDKKGTVVVIAASEQYELLGKTSLGEPSSATPAIADGVIYLRTKSRLFSLGCAANESTHPNP